MRPLEDTRVEPSERQATALNHLADLSPRGKLERIKQALEARRLRFHIDGIRASRLCGWVYRRDDARQRLSILVENGAGVRVAHLADLYRADVHRAAVGSDGYCGFAVPLRGVSTDTIVACKRPFRVLFRGPVTRATPTAGGIVPRGDLLFRLDPGGHLSGWLSSVTQPDERLGIVLRVDGRIVSGQVACLFREDRPPDARDGYHGFAFACPAGGRQIELIDRASGRCLYNCRARA